MTRPRRHGGAKDRLCGLDPQIRQKLPPATVRLQDLCGLRQLQAAVGYKFVQGLVLHDHDRITPFDEKLHAGPMSLLWQV